MLPFLFKEREDKMNKELMNKIYQTIFDNEPGFKESCRRVDSAVREIVDSHAGTLGKEEAERFSDDFMAVISDARHDGFEIGTRLAFKLLMEMMLD